MDASVVVSVIAVVVALFTTVMAGLTRYAVAQRDKDVDRRLLVLEASTAVLLTAQHATDLAVRGLNGDMALVRQSHQGFDGDIRQIKESMITRSEWETWREALDKRFDDLVSAVRGALRPQPGRYASPGSDPMVPAAKPR